MGTINNDDSATLSLTAPAITETDGFQNVSFIVTLARGAIAARRAVWFGALLGEPAPHSVSVLSSACEEGCVAIAGSPVDVASTVVIAGAVDAAAGHTLQQSPPLTRKKRPVVV